MQRQQRTEWPPDSRIAGYQGPYPRWELEAARRALIRMIADSTFSVTVERLKPRIGISSSFGQAHSPPPIPSQSAAITSHQNQELQMPHTPNSMQVSQSTNWCRQDEPQMHVRPLMNLSENSPHQPQSNPVLYLGSPTASCSSMTVPSNRPPDPRYHSTPTRPIMDQSRSRPSLTNIETGPSGDSGYYGENSIFDTPPAGREKGPNPHVSNSVNLPRRDSPTGTSKIPVVSLKRQSENQSLSPPVKRMKTDEPSVAQTNSSTTCLLHKCDFCQFTAKTAHQMENHLQSSKHFSGSLYNTVADAKGHKLVSVEKMLAVKNQYSMTNALIVTCPECHEIFQDIFMCALHHKYKHGSVNGLYAICPIIKHYTVSVSAKAVCGQCSLSFPKHKDLHQHWRKVVSHHPIQEPANVNTFAMYICPYCAVIFYNNFLACKSHVLEHKRSSETFAVEVKHVMMSNNTHEMLPFNTAGQHKDGLQQELDILKNMQKFYKTGISGAKGKAHAVLEQMNALRQMIQSSITQ